MNRTLLFLFACAPFFISACDSSIEPAPEGPIAPSIKNGELAGENYPGVVLLTMGDGAGNPLWRCSGTFLSQTVILTAGHCTEPPAARAWVWTDSDVESGIPVIPPSA